MEDAIEWEVRRLRADHSRGLSGMREEHLYQWLQEAQKAETEEDISAETGAGATMEAETEMEAEMEMVEMEPLDLFHCKRVVELIQADLRESRTAEEYTWKAVVLIPKGGGEYYNTGLVKVVRKVVTVIIN